MFVLRLPWHKDYMLRKNISGLCHSNETQSIEFGHMRSKCQIFRCLKRASSHVNLSCCRLCKSVGDISHSKNLFAKNNRMLLASVEELYGSSLSQNKLLLHLVCRPCERQVNNFKAFIFKNMIMETQKFLERTHFSVN